MHCFLLVFLSKVFGWFVCWVCCGAVGWFFRAKVALLQGACAGFGLVLVFSSIAQELRSNKSLLILTAFLSESFDVY